jgi:RNA polymerase sigma-70 factor (ECF subfamily)
MEEVYIKKVVEGDVEAFRFFIRKYQHMAFSVAISVVKDEFTAEEVVQDAFMKAFENLKSFKFQSKFSTWLYRIVVNQAFRQLRKSKQHIVGYNETIESELSTEPNGFKNLQENDQAYYINEALKILSPKESLALRLFYLEEHSIEEVCDITGWSGSNTKVILHRARQHFYGALKNLLKSEVKMIL